MHIARTESTRVLEDSKYHAFNDLADNENVQVFKIWHTMDDEAVRDTHDAMEGVKVAYDEDFVLPSDARCQYHKGTGVAAEDINCRCYVEYVTELVKAENTEKINQNNDIKAENIESRPVDKPKNNESEAVKDNKPSQEELEAVDYYVSGDGMYINDYLRDRNNPVERMGEMTDFYKEMVKQLEKATDREHGYKRYIAV